MAISIAIFISLVVLSNRLYTGNFDILKYSPIIQLNKVAANSISVEYYVAVVVALFLFGLCLCAGIVKFKNAEF